MVRQNSGFRSHDVRKLHLCAECGRLGAYGSDLANRIDAPLVVRSGDCYIHPRCMRIEHLVLLSVTELGEIRLGDVDERTMETILLALNNKAQNTLPGTW